MSRRIPKQGRGLVRFGAGVARGSRFGPGSSGWRTGRCSIPARRRSSSGGRCRPISSGDVQNNQETITYTVYNEQADPETGVLLTTTLEPGVTLLAAPRSSPTRAARTWPGAWGRSRATTARASR